ncbi:MAG: glycosyltransferase family 25 protein [Parvularculaceae bacterium]
MTRMPLFVINLDRRPDRLVAQRTQAARLCLDIECIPAIDGADPRFAARAEGFARNGPIGPLNDGTLACSMSHALAWKRLLDSSKEAAFILEDDAELSAKLPAFLDAFGDARLGLDLVRLERKSNERGLFVEKSGYEIAGCELRRLHSLHAGAAAYIISRRGAQVALDRFEGIDIPVDHYLFSPARRTVFAALRPYQVFPALARQSLDIGGRSDVGSRTKRGDVASGARQFGYHARRTLFEAGAFLGALVGAGMGRLAIRRAEFDEAAQPARRE